ncbi:MAG: alpha-ketoglutarate-dependent dioxygenase AlkB [Flavobacteriaceae bacterium]|nr:alpha-ketoglutarate-dependent dioxygenase AlkB [Flavobacteriaceae bacterium]
MQKGYNLKLKDADVWYYPNVFSEQESLLFFNTLKVDVKWQQDKITVFGKTYDQPRLTALYANNSMPYSYSKIKMQPHTFSADLLNIKQKVESICKVEFTSCLLNFYRSGLDSNGWHADNEKELGKHPIIASVSLGAPRVFHLKHRKDKSLKHKLTLEPGSLLLMQGQTQHNWLHQIPKTKKRIGERINLTFRIIK